MSSPASHACLFFGSLGLLACGGIAVVDADRGTGGGGSGGTSATTDAAVTTTATTTGGGGGGGMADFDIEVDHALGSADCMPAVPPDPMNVQLGLFVDNTMGTQPVQVSVTSARITGPTGETSFEMSAVGMQLVMAGQSGVLEFEKVPDSASGTHGCDWCQETNAEITVDLAASGMAMEVTGPVDSFGCAL